MKVESDRQLGVWWLLSGSIIYLIYSAIVLPRMVKLSPGCFIGITFPFFMVFAAIVLTVKEPIAVAIIIGTVHFVAMLMLAIVGFLSIGESIWGNSMVGFTYIDLLFLPIISFLPFRNEILMLTLMTVGGTVFHALVGYTVRRIVNDC